MILFLYLIVSIIAGRKNPLFYLLFPLALLQGPGAFITDQAVSLGGRLPLALASNFFGDVIFILFVIIALWVKPAYTIKDLFLGTKLFYIYLVFILIVLVLFVMRDSNLSEALLVSRFFMYISLYYLLWLRIFSSATPAQFIEFFRVIAIINIVSSVLYILNSGNFFEIFPKENLYREISSGEKYFFRDFRTVPILGNFIFAGSLLIFLRKEYIIDRRIVLMNLTIWPLAILYTFTRGLLLTLIAIILLSLISSFFLRTFSISKKAISIFVTISLFFTSVLLIQLIFPNEYEFFLKRIESTQYEGFDEGNIKVRGEYLEVAYQIIEEEGSILLGSGLSKSNYDTMGELGAWAGDSMWPTHLLHTGLLGILLVSMIMLYFVADSFLQFFKIQSLFHQLCFILLSSLIITTFNGSGLNGGSMSLMIYGLYAVIRKNSSMGVERYFSANPISS